jgi:LmbE family N-acetylglucosaminyl deacetylase
MARRLAAIVAHPDDDTWGVAGTVALHADDPALRFVLVHVTSGEAGQIADGSGATRETLGAVREREDRRSWAALGREPDRHEWFRLPDHGVEDEPYDALVERIVAVLREERPDVVITFGPDGITAHPDHITVGRATTDAFHRVRREGGSGLQRLLHNALPRSWIDAWNDQLVAAGREPFDPGQLYQPRGVADDTIGVIVDCSAVAARKLAALREHVTQATDMDDGGDDLESLGREAFVIAWPPRDPGAPVLGDVFEGLAPG